MEICTLSARLEEVIRRRAERIFFPQEREDVCICCLVQLLVADYAAESRREFATLLYLLRGKDVQRSCPLGFEQAL